MTVRDLFKEENVEEVFIDENFEGSYWESCAKFINESWQRDLESMSDKQQSWARRILADCIEERLS